MDGGNLMQLAIELRPHIGVTHTDLGDVSEELDQYMVMVSSDEVPKPKFVGYLPKRENAPFLPCVPFLDYPNDLQAAIVDKVGEKVGRTVACGIIPVVPQEWIDDEGEAEDEGDE